MNWVVKVDTPKFLVVRHLYQDPGFYDLILQWIAHNHPECVPFFKVHDLPHPVPNYSNYVLHIPWLQDPVQNWSEEAYATACQIAEAFDEQNIPIVNRVDKLLNAAKSRGSELIRQAGLRTPIMARIENVEEFQDTLLNVPLPFFIREDWGHGGPMIPIETREDAQSADLSLLKRPVAIERIEVQSPDGLYRKYRYVVAGDAGVCHHLVHSGEWITHGTKRVVNEETTAEELAYVAHQDPNHEAFQAARRALELDFVAFDYGYTPDGNPVVWEANPYPLIKFGVKSTRYRNHAIHRTILAMLVLYLRMGGQTVSAKMEANLVYPEPALR